MLDIYIEFFRHNWISEKWVMFYCAVWAVELFHFIHTFLTEIITLGAGGGGRKQFLEMVIKVSPNTLPPLHSPLPRSS